MSEKLPEQPLDEPGPSRKQRRCRRWFQFDLGSLLLLVTLCGVLLAAWRAYLAPYRAQRETMALIERLKGSYQTQEAATWASRLHLVPTHNITLVNLADCDQPVEYVDAVSRLPRLETLIVGGLAFGDEHLARLQKLSALRLLVLDSTNVTADGMNLLRHRLPGMRMHRSERRAIAAIRAFGGVNTESADVPPELRKLVGTEFFEFATVLRLENGRFTDVDLLHLTALNHPTHLYLDHTKVTDAGLAHLAGLKTLVALGLSDTQVTHDGLMRLAALTNLEILALNNTRLTEAGVARIAGLKNLKALALMNTHLTDAGVAHLADLKNLEWLCVGDNRLTDAGVAYLAPLTNLTTLNLNNTKITHTGLADLARTNRLVALALIGTDVTNAGLVHLAAMNNLEKLYLDGSGATDADLAKLRQALPKCEIWPKPSDTGR